MSDASQGPGWWQASDLNWYPPSARQGRPSPVQSSGPPGEGWWQASDGKWYPPSARPDAPSPVQPPPPAWAVPKPKRNWRKKRKWIVIGSVPIVLLILLIVLAMTGHTKSYRDGYAYGVRVVQLGGLDNTYAQEACDTSAPGYGGNNPPGDNRTQWYEGCVAGWNDAVNKEEASASSNSRSAAPPTTAQRKKKSTARVESPVTTSPSNTTTSTTTPSATIGSGPTGNTAINDVLRGIASQFGFDLADMNGTVDHNDPIWIRWTYHSPDADSIYGYSEYLNGSWEVIDDDNENVGCGAHPVPTEVLTYFGDSCSP